MKKGELKKMIIKVLTDKAEARNNDVLLTLCIWNRNFPNIVSTINNKPYVLLEDIKFLPREDNVKRIRAVIQNVEKKFLPTTPEVRKKRKISEIEWENYLSKNNLK